MPCVNHPLVEEPLTRCSRCGRDFCPDCHVRIGGLPYCAPCKEERILDLRSGVTDTSNLASLARRAAAILLDFTLLWIPFIPVAALVSRTLTADSTPEMILLLSQQLSLSIGYLVASILYEGLMVAHGGQTLGKKALKIKVVTPEGNDLTRGQAWGRAVMRQLLGMVPCIGIFDYLAAFGEERTCIHDLAARTRVVNWEKN